MSTTDPQTQAPDNALAAACQELQRAKGELEEQLRQCAASLEQAEAALHAERAKCRQAEAALQEAEVKFRAIAQSANDAIIAADSQGRITFWNQGAQTIFGYSEAEALGQPLTTLMPEQYRSAHTQGLERLQATGQSQLLGKTIEMQGVRKDRREFPLELSLTSWLGGGGPLFSGIVHDITERKQAEQMIAEQDHLLRTLIEILPDSIYVKDTNNGHVFNNIAHVRIWGEGRANGTHAQTDFDDFSRQLAAQYYAHEQEVIKTGQPLTKEETVLDPEGRKHWLLTTTMPLRDAQGQITALVGVSRDITERKQAEKALAEERTLLRTLINNLPDYIYVKDTEGRFLLVNEAMRRHLGAASSEAVIGKTDFDFSPLDLAARYQADEQRLFQSKQPLIGHEEPMFDHPTRTQRWVLTTKVPFCDSQGQVVGLVGMNRDITERKRAEEEKARLLAAVSQQRAELHALTTRLAEVQETERQQLARELHDQVGQNLSALGFNLNFIETQLPPALANRGSILARLNDSLALVEQTTERVRDVMAELRPPMLDDYGLLDTLEWYANRVAARAGLAITVQGMPMQTRLAPAVENTLFRIAQEALTNVAKHARATHVIFSLETDQQRVRLVVADNGIGFESAGAMRAPKRQGWGLRLMNERVEMIGGRLRIESQPGQGTRVVVEVGQGQETGNGHYHLPGR